MGRGSFFFSTNSILFCCWYQIRIGRAKQRIGLSFSVIRLAKMEKIDSTEHRRGRDDGETLGTPVEGKLASVIKM